MVGRPQTPQLRRHFSSMKAGPVWMQPSSSAQAGQPASSSKQLGSTVTFWAGVWGGGREASCSAGASFLPAASSLKGVSHKGLNERE